MDANLVERLAKRLGVRVVPRKAPHGMSGSPIYLAHREDGTDCVLQFLRATNLESGPPTPWLQSSICNWKTMVVGWNKA